MSFQTKGTTLGELNTAASNTIISNVDTGNDHWSTEILSILEGSGMQTKLGREFSRMSREAKTVVIAGRAFYDWQQRQNDRLARALGFPKSAAFADGYKGSRQYSSVVPDIEVEEMPKEHRDFFEALNALTDIRKKVFERTYRDRMDRSRVARSINCSVRSVDHKLREAYMILAGVLRSKGWTL